MPEYCTKVTVIKNKLENQTFKTGLAQAIKYLKLDVLICDDSINFFDLFYSNKLDVVIANTENLNRPLYKNIVKYKDSTELVLFLDEWHSLTDTSKKIIDTLIKNEVKIKKTFSFFENNYEWEKQFGFNVEEILPAANTIKYTQEGKINKKFKVDNSFVGNFDAEILQELSKIKESLYIYSDDFWPTESYIGNIEEKSLPDVYKNSKNNLIYLSEKNNKLKEEILDIIICGGKVSVIGNNKKLFFKLKEQTNNFDLETIKKQHSYINRAKQILCLN